MRSAIGVSMFRGTLRPSLVALVAACAAACGTVESENGDAAVPGAHLAALNISAGALVPAFDPEVADYDVDLSIAVADIVFTPVAAGSSSVITVDGVATESGAASPPIALPLAVKSVTISVTTADGTRRDYRVGLRRGVDALASLALSAGTLAPGFSPEVATYAAAYPLSTSSLDVTVTPLYPDRATLQMDSIAVASGTATPVSLGVGQSSLSVSVTSPVLPTRIYSVGIRRGVDALSAIDLHYAGAAIGNPLSPAFVPEVSDYSVDIGWFQKHVQVAPATLDSTAAITVGGGPLPSGQPSSAIPLNNGLTRIPITVTGPDGTPRTYNLTVNRPAAPGDPVRVTQRVIGSDGVGSSVALSGNRLAVGAPLEASSSIGIDGDESDASARLSGAVYVFARDGAAWTQDAYIKASNTQVDDLFGMAVAMWGDTLVVGAPLEDSGADGIDGDQLDNSERDSGAVYVFRRRDGRWIQEAYLKAAHSATNDAFGASVAISGDLIAVGAPAESSSARGIDNEGVPDAAERSGAVYLFRRNQRTWRAEAYVKSSNSDAGDEFGASVSVWGNRVVVGAQREASGADGPGGDQDDDSQASAGAAYVFAYDDGSWSQEAYLKASNSNAGDGFGVVSLWGDTVVVGAPGEASSSRVINGDQSDEAAAGAGAAYVFVATGAVWAQQAYVKASYTTAGDAFGTAVSVCGDVLAVGAPLDSAAPSGEPNPAYRNSGAAYYFTRSRAVWERAPRLRTAPSNVNQGFGTSVSCWGDAIASGAYDADIDGIPSSGLTLVVR